MVRFSYIESRYLKQGVGYDPIGICLQGFRLKNLKAQYSFHVRE